MQVEQSEQWIRLGSIDCQQGLYLSEDQKWSHTRALICRGSELLAFIMTYIEATNLKEVDPDKDHQNHAISLSSNSFVLCGISAANLIDC